MVRVLVVGPRNGLCDALVALGIPFVVWSERGRRRPKAEHLHVAPVDVSRGAAKREAEKLAEYGPFSHVIAGTETAVLAAAVARRVVGARRYAHTTVIRCRDKLHMKNHLRGHGIPMTAFLDGRNPPSPSAITRELGLPAVLKPRMKSGARGIKFVNDLSEMTPSRLRGQILEKFVDAPEVSVESFIGGGEVLFQNITEYAQKTRVNVVPGAVSGATPEAVLDLNRRVIQALDIKWGMTHLEVYLTREGPLFGEIALRPPGGYIMDLLRLAWGFDPWIAYVAMELDRPFAFGSRPLAHAAALILHPGEGTVSEIRGLDEVRAMDTVVSAEIRIGPGARVEARTGVGRDVGRVLMRADSRPDLLRTLSEVDATLRFSMVPFEE